MYVIEKRIEKLENQLFHLKSIQDDVSIEIADRGTAIADEARAAVDNNIEDIMSEINFYETGLDESEVEDELREELVEVVRMDF